MPLSDYVPPSITVKIPGSKGIFRVRGLNIQDVSALAQSHLDDLLVLAEEYKFLGLTIFHKLADQAFLQGLIIKAPRLTAEIIAHAADEPDSWPSAARLPLPIQLKALMDIALLTFEDFGGPKPFFDSLISLAVQLKLALMPNYAPLPKNMSEAKTPGETTPSSNTFVN